MRSPRFEPAGRTLLEGELDQQLLIRYQAWRHADGNRKSAIYPRTILRQCEQAQLAVNNVGQTLVDRSLSVLAPGTVAIIRYHAVVQTLRAELPDVLVYLHENGGAVLGDMKLLSGQLDMAVLL